MLRNLNYSPAAGKRILGTPKSGVPGAAIPATGQDGPSFLYPSLSLPADASREIRGWVLTRPSAGVLTTFENGAYEYDPQGATGEQLFTFQLYVDGVATGAPATVTFDIGSGASVITGVAISPAVVTLAGGATQAFSATVSGTGSPSQAVTWSASAGTINASGLFTAPTATGAIQTISITATSVQDTTKAGIATATVSAALLPGGYPVPGDVRSGVKYGASGEFVGALTVG
jgi:uncharacterized protein YjdB